MSKPDEPIDFVAFADVAQRNVRRYASADPARKIDVQFRSSDNECSWTYGIRRASLTRKDAESATLIRDIYDAYGEQRVIGHSTTTYRLTGAQAAAVADSIGNHLTEGRVEKLRSRWTAVSMVVAFIVIGVFFQDIGPLFWVVFPIVAIACYGVIWLVLRLLPTCIVWLRGHDL